MLKDLLKPNSKMSRKSYKTYLLIYSISIFIVGIIILLTSASMVGDKYFGYGLGTGLVIGALLVLFRTLNERQFEKQYLYSKKIKSSRGDETQTVLGYGKSKSTTDSFDFQWVLDAFDERHQYIDTLCFRIIYGLELLFLILIFLINLYNPLHLHFERVLIWSLIFLSYGFFIIRAILRKLV